MHRRRAAPTSSSRRSAPLPKNWQKLRLRIARRDNNACQLAASEDCLGYCPPGDGGECDHVGDPADHRPANLRWVCEPCHRERSAQQAVAANPLAKPRRRAEEEHPGGR